ITAEEPALKTLDSAFRLARSRGLKLAELLGSLVPTAARAAPLAYPDLLAAGRVLPPVTEEPGVRLLVTGTGLTHTGSVQQRDQMHKKPEAAAPLSDSRRMFEMGLAGGRPAPGQRGAAPEWFYKGDGRILRGSGQSLEIPPFAPDGGEEPEIAGVYMVDDRGVPCRLGFTQGNEWSDHVTENINYLYLAPSKLRTCAIGPELVSDLAFEDVRGRCRVLRDGAPIYDSGELPSGERNTCHSLANLEDHHFKFPQHRVPGDIHVHFFGTSKLSFRQRDWMYRTGDVVEVSFQGLGAPLRNPVLRHEPSATPVRVEVG
ncbi:MAG TPA: AraD1 family protein, partial [Gemmataceae bacterium]|nr:AraD1 family protein [Gemmataceae bacterium]